MSTLNRTSLWIWLTTLVAATTQVSVSLHNEYDPHLVVSLTCNNLLPGHCCTAPSEMFWAYSAHVVTFQDLNAWDIAAIWRDGQPASPGSRPAKNGCLGEVWRTRPGPGTWTWGIWEEPSAQDSPTPSTGASYIEMPRRLPVDGETSNWLSAQGVLGLVWGDGKWFQNAAVSSLLGYGSGVKPRSRLRRDVRSELKGKVYARPPPGLMYPTLVEMNGTKYSAEEDGGFVYKDTAGTVLDLTQLADLLKKP
ncbi:MAG: hypothetical protein Q9208_005034 [Pyrenodesmia sp. 3 TL-2023]